MRRNTWDPLIGENLSPWGRLAVDEPSLFPFLMAFREFGLGMPAPMRQKRRTRYRYLRRRFGHEALARRMLLGSAIFIGRFLPKDGSPAQKIHGI